MVYICNPQHLGDWARIAMNMRTARLANEFETNLSFIVRFCHIPNKNKQSSRAQIISAFEPVKGFDKVCNTQNKDAL